MRPTRITYDPDGDVLYVNFGQPTASTGYQVFRPDIASSRSQGADGLWIDDFQLFPSCIRRARDSPARYRRTGGRKSVASEHSWFRSCQSISHRCYARRGKIRPSTQPIPATSNWRLIPQPIRQRALKNSLLTPNFFSPSVGLNLFGSTGAFNQFEVCVSTIGRAELCFQRLSFDTV